MHGITAIMIAAVLFLPLGAQPVPGRMSFGTRSIDLGTVSEDSAMVTASVEWKNTGDSPVAVLMAKTTCSCLAVEYDRTPVPPGGTGRMVLTYYPKGHPGKIDRKVFVYAGLEASGPDAVLYECRGFAAGDNGHGRSAPGSPDVQARTAGAAARGDRRPGDRI